MKGLLLKDFYMSWKYCRSYLFIAVIFFAAAFVDGQKMFYIMYPAVLSGMVCVSLISYDEKSKWNLYAETLPVSRADSVSAKYIITAIFVSIIMLLAFAVQILSSLATVNFVFSKLNMSEILAVISSVSVVALAGPAILLPLIFKFGIEKGRIAYYIVLGVACAAAFMFPAKDNFTFLLPYVSSFTIFLAALAVFLLSWFISIKLYEGRSL